MFAPPEPFMAGDENPWNPEPHTAPVRHLSPNWDPRIPGEIGDPESPGWCREPVPDGIPGTPERRGTRRIGTIFRGGRRRRSGGRRTGRRTRRVVVGVALFLVAMLLLVPLLEVPLAKVVSSRVARAMACPGATANPPRVTVRGGWLLPQVLRRRLSEVEVALEDTAVGGVEHVAFSAVLRDATQPEPGTTKIGSIDATIALGFTNMPAVPGMPRPTFGRSPDGLLTVKVTPPAESAKNVKGTLLARLELRGETMKVVPQRLLVFGKVVPAEQAVAQTGGARTEKLPHLPDGLTYRSIVPEPDGLHIELGGVVTTPFSDLPAEVDGQAVTYAANNGMLGISTSKNLPLIGDIPLTIYASPRLDGGVLRLEPRSVTILGSDRKPDDLLAALVLSQVKQESLARRLPTLPAGVRYRSVSVDGTGIKVVIGGTTVKPFSELPAKVGGRPTTYGARNGLLAVTSRGTSSASPMTVVLYAKPTIAGTVLDLAPRQIEIFGVRFPAADVLSHIKAPTTRYPLRALPTNLAYRSVDVLADGLRITLSGRNVTLGKDTLGGGC